MDGGLAGGKGEENVYFRESGRMVRIYGLR